MLHRLVSVALALAPYLSIGVIDRVEKFTEAGGLVYLPNELEEAAETVEVSLSQQTDGNYPFAVPAQRFLEHLSQTAPKSDGADRFA